MIQYSPEFREAALRRILPPNSEKISDVARDLGVPVQTLCGWKKRSLKTVLALKVARILPNFPLKKNWKLSLLP